MKESLQIGFRITRETRDYLNTIEHKTQIADHQLIKSLIAAAIDHYIEHGTLTFPIKLQGEDSKIAKAKRARK